LAINGASGLKERTRRIPPVHRAMVASGIAIKLAITEKGYKVWKW
jgi:hypothetical protein